MSNTPSISSLMGRKASEVKRPPQFPAANYRFIITGYNVGSWSKSGSVGLGFNFRPVACLDAENDDEPELQAEVKEALEKYGDWTKKEFGKGFTWFTGKDDNKTHLLVSPLTFTIEDKDGNLSGGASQFYLSENGEESGFAVDILHADVNSEMSIGEIADACVNQEFCGMMAYKPNEKNPDRPILELISVSEA